MSDLTSVATHPRSPWQALRKLLRFTAIYGPGRTLYKAAGRLRIGVPKLTTLRTLLSRPKRDIGLVGCGQFAFATIGYFLMRHQPGRLMACYDVDAKSAASLAASLGVARVAASGEELLALPGLRTVYIASNHASHTPYAVAALARGLDVYVEKPVAVTPAQLSALIASRRTAAAAGRGRLFAGYNRPFSAAVRELRRRIVIHPAQGFSLQCFIAGHVIGPKHWYRHPDEGTRVCGNLGHWLDLFVHVLAWRSMPERLEISLVWADDAERDDNCSVTMLSERGDLCSIMLSSRAEPFEGINESIQLQHGEALAKIDDFRRMTLWQCDRVLRRHYWPKDVGHRHAILQPFAAPDGPVPPRDWHEVEHSTLLMLHIADMVRSGTRDSRFSFAEARAALPAPDPAHR